MLSEKQRRASGAGRSCKSAGRPHCAHYNGDMNKNTERSRELRERRKKAGLAEVRGIWAPLKMHAKIKRTASQMQATKT